MFVDKIYGNLPAHYTSRAAKHKHNVLKQGRKKKSFKANIRLRAVLSGRSCEITIEMCDHANKAANAVFMLLWIDNIIDFCIPSINLSIFIFLCFSF